MPQARQAFTEAEHRRVTEAVVAAESATAAEIVPAVARVSGRYDRAEDVAGLWVGLIALAIVYLAFPQPAAEHGSWDTRWTVLHLAALVAAMLVGFLVGAVLAARIGPLRRLFTPRKQMHEEVLTRAQHTFFHRRVHRTAGQGGVLIYVSLYERLAAVIADQTALEKLGRANVDKLCQELTERLRHVDVITALCETATLAGSQLAQVLPRADDDANEIADALIELDH